MNAQTNTPDTNAGDPTAADQVTCFDVMDIDRVKEKTSLGTTSIYELMNEGTFPPNFTLTGRRKVWLRTDVEEWLKWRCATARGLSKWTPPAEKD